MELKSVELNIPEVVNLIPRIFRRVLFVVLVTLTAAAQDTPKVEIFGGYSFLKFTVQPRLSFESANLKGWKLSVKHNLTPRIGLLGDFSGHYGQQAFTQPRGNWSQTRHQHTYMFGPELRVAKSRHLGLNVRALIGVTNTNFPGLKPRIDPMDSNAVAAAFGGNLDYRITNRLSYRIIEPELLISRGGSSTSESWQQFNWRLSSGFVYTPGTLSPRSSSRLFSFGVMGGAALTDAFNHESVGRIIGPGGLEEQTRSRSFSTQKDYVIGAMVEIALWRDLFLEIDALYRLMNLTMAGGRPDGSLHSISPATVVTWELPVLAKYKFGSSSVKPFLEAGPSFRTSGNLNAAAPSTYGGTAGIGVEMRIWRLKLGPILRYTHWATDPDFTAFRSRTKRNQFELLLGLSF